MTTAYLKNLGEFLFPIDSMALEILRLEHISRLGRLWARERYEAILQDSGQAAVKKDLPLPWETHTSYKH